MSDAASDSILPCGKENTAFRKYFMGQSYLNMLNTEDVMVANVTFKPGYRNNWHIHHASKGGEQILLCTAGSGWFQVRDEASVSLESGSVVTIPTNRKRWHGVKKDLWLSHIAIEVLGENTSSERCEPVSDEHYENL